MAAARFALLALLALISGCALYVEGDDEPSSVDAAWPWEPVDASWSPPDAWPTNCWAGSDWDCPAVGGAACFVYPWDVAITNSGSSPDTACMVPPTGEIDDPITLSGTLQDFETALPVTGQVELIAEGDTPFLVTATDGDGAWSVVLPAGTPRTLTLRTQAAGYVDVYNPQLRLDDAATQEVPSISMRTTFLASLPAFVGISHEPGTALVTVEARDCYGQVVQNAVVTLATEPGMSGTCPAFQPWARVFYAEGNSWLPVRRTQASFTDGTGRAYLVDVPPSGAFAVQYVQLWGFVGAVGSYVDQMTLLAEYPIHTYPDALVQVAVAAPR